MATNPIAQEDKREKRLAQKRANYKKNREKALAEMRARYHALKDSDGFRDSERERYKEWYAKNKAKVIAKTSAYHKKNKAQAVASVIKWLGKHPEYRRIQQAKVRAKRKTAQGQFTQEDIKGLLKAQRGKCAYCRVSLRKGYHIDHIIPLAKGGSNWPRNLQVTCGPCNRRKQSRHPIVFAQELGLLL